MRRVLTAVAMTALVACGARNTPKDVAAIDTSTTTTLAPETTSPSTTSTTAPSPRSTNGIQPGMLAAITSCEPQLKAVVLDVVAVNGPYAAALLHGGGSTYRRSLTFSNGRWYDGNHGQAACAPRVDMQAGSPPSGWGGNAFSGYFDASSPRQGTMADGGIGTDPAALVVGLSGSKATKGSIGGGYWIVLTIDVAEPGVYCDYDATGKLLHETTGLVSGGGPAGPPGAVTETVPPPDPAHCPATAPPVT